MHSFSGSPESSSNQNEGDFMVAVATLVTEGRIPGPSSESGKSKDFHEGPHCNFITGIDRDHKCDIKNPLCEKFKRNRATILKLYEKGVPLCIEVYFTCICKEPENIDTGNLFNAVLLEQWFFCASPNRGVPTTPFNTNQLISAIRSQLYFSQISAWLVTQDKTCPITSGNLRYRLSSPEDLLTPLKFTLSASKHEFPVSQLGNGGTTLLSISFSSSPRTSTQPAFDCVNCLSKKMLELGGSSSDMMSNTNVKKELNKEELIFDDRMHTSCTQKGKHCCEEMEDNNDSIINNKVNECTNKIGLQSEGSTTGNKQHQQQQQQWFLRHANKKPKASHNNVEYDGRSNVNSFASTKKHVIDKEVTMDFERQAHPSFYWPQHHHSFNDLNQSSVQEDKGQLLLDAIERSGQKKSVHNNFHYCVSNKNNWWPKIKQQQSDECDNFLCDMSESDITKFSRKERNNKIINIYADDDDDDDDNHYCDSRPSRISMIRPTTKKMRDVSNINIMSNGSRISSTTGARKKITFDGEEGPTIITSSAQKSFNDLLIISGSSSNSSSTNSNARAIPAAPPVQDQTKIRRNLGNTTSTVFDSRTGLPLSSSPAPVRKGKSRFDFDSSLDSVSAIKSALFSSSFSADEESENEGSIVSPCSPEIYSGPKRNIGSVIYRRKGRPTSLLGTFEESVLNGRLEPVSTVHGFTAELGASGSFVPKHVFVPVTAFFYAFGDHDKVSTPYLGHISLSKRGFNVPKAGTVQVTLFNPLGTVVKMFVLPYDLSEMPPNCQTFVRQRTLYLPTDFKHENLEFIPKWLRFVIHVRFMSSKSGKIYLHSDIRMIIMRKTDMDTATAHDVDINYELRSFTHMPTNPTFSPRK